MLVSLRLQQIPESMIDYTVSQLPNHSGSTEGDDGIKRGVMNWLKEKDVNEKVLWIKEESIPRSKADTPILAEGDTLFVTHSLPSSAAGMQAKDLEHALLRSFFYEVFRQRPGLMKDVCPGKLDLNDFGYMAP